MENTDSLCFGCKFHEQGSSEWPCVSCVRCHDYATQDNYSPITLTLGIPDGTRPLGCICTTPDEAIAIARHHGIALDRKDPATCDLTYKGSTVTWWASLSQMFLILPLIVVQPKPTTRY